ncbi:MAG: hypothetical protein ACR2M1_07660 [Gemmatimonadaceae bacterium]
MSALGSILNPKRLAAIVTVVALFNFIAGLASIALTPSPAWVDNLLRLREAFATPALLLIIAALVTASEQLNENFRRYVVPSLSQSRPARPVGSEAQNGVSYTRPA